MSKSATAPDRDDLQPGEERPDRSNVAMCSDGRRSLIALAGAVLIPLAMWALFAAMGLSTNGWAKGFAFHIMLVLLGWNVFAVIYVVETTLTFARIESVEFRARMAARRSQRAGLVRLIQPRGDGPTFAIESALVSFAVVLILPNIHSVRINQWLLVPATVSILLSSWALSIVSYTLHYAQKDLAGPGLEFPGTRTGGWSDYLYFSIAVATTFGATDVTIATPSMRQVVNLHTILTFLYNSVIVALLASLIIR